jgi:hypothetical protein
MSDDNPDREIALAKLQYDHQLARLGLQGTLWGAWASLIANRHDCCGASGHQPLRNRGMGFCCDGSGNSNPCDFLWRVHFRSYA